MHLLHLYRPQVPDLRAQAIQVMHTCHALARRGHRVKLFAQPLAGFAGGVAEALAPYGLAPHPNLELTLLPWQHRGLAGLDFRARALAWLLRAENGAVVYARTKRHAAQIAALKGPLAFTLVFESHEVASAQARERGESAEALERLERRVLAGADALVTNCEGTLEVLEEVYGPGLPARRQVIHNGTDPARARPPVDHPGTVAGYVGSLRAYKNIHVLLEAAALLPEGFRLRLVGGVAGQPEFERARGLAGPRAGVSPAVPYALVPELLAGMDVLVLSLADDLYGRRLASPLKLWDYLATGLPVVAPDLPSVRAICGDAFEPCTPGDAPSVARAIERAAARGPGPTRCRTWDDRAAEIEAFLAG
ncbi:MAG: glycosyltransferase [Pseudomonadota bacterium]